MGVTVFDEYSRKGRARAAWTSAAFYTPLLRRVLKRVPASVLRRYGASPRALQAAVVLVNSRSMRLLNKRFRGKDSSTDVLSFESAPDDYPYLGEIVISPAFARVSARAYRRPLETELSLLFVHGLLHTLGYDHATQRERERMFALQDSILGQRVRYE